MDRMASPKSVLPRIREHVQNFNYDCSSNGESWLLQRLAAFRAAVVFDVGANVGNWLAEAYAALSSSQFHAFEAVGSTAAMLQERFGNKPRITTNSFGLWNKSTTITLHVWDCWSEVASYMLYTHSGRYRTVACPVQSGDEYMQSNEINRIDLQG